MAAIPNILDTRRWDWVFDNEFPGDSALERDGLFGDDGANAGFGESPPDLVGDLADGNTAAGANFHVYSFECGSGVSQWDDARWAAAVS